MNDFKKEAMAEAGFDKLPKASTKKYEGLAVAKVKKINNTEVYVVCHYPEDARRTLVAHDFSKGMIAEILEVYPDPKRMALTEKEILQGLRERLVEEGEDADVVGKWTKAQCVKAVKEMLEVKIELKKLGVDEGSDQLQGSLKDLLKLKDNLDIKE